MYEVKDLGLKSNFDRASELVEFKLNCPGNIWRMAGGPDYNYLHEVGVKASDHIICALDEGLFDCGELERYTWTKGNMASVYGRYSSGRALQLRWYRLPAAVRSCS